MPFPRSAPVLRSVLLYSREKRGRGGRGYRTTERAVSMPRSTEGKTPQKTPESSAPRPYIGYVSSQWHTRQPQALEQLAAISWCRSHAYRTTERAVSMPRSTEGKNLWTSDKNARIECSAAVYRLYNWLVAYQTAPVT